MLTYEHRVLDGPVKPTTQTAIVSSSEVLETERNTQITSVMELQSFGGNEETEIIKSLDLQDLQPVEMNQTEDTSIDNMLSETENVNIEFDPKTPGEVTEPQTDLNETTSSDQHVELDKNVDETHDESSAKVEEEEDLDSAHGVKSRGRRSNRSKSKNTPIIYPTELHNLSSNKETEKTKSLDTYSHEASKIHQAVERDIVKMTIEAEVDQVLVEELDESNQMNELDTTHILKSTRPSSKRRKSNYSTPERYSKRLQGQSPDDEPLQMVLRSATKNQGIKQQLISPRYTKGSELQKEAEHEVELENEKNNEAVKDCLQEENIKDAEPVKRTPEKIHKATKSVGVLGSKNVKSAEKKVKHKVVGAAVTEDIVSDMVHVPSREDLEIYSGNNAEGDKTYVEEIDHTKDVEITEREETDTFVTQAQVQEVDKELHKTTDTEMNRDEGKEEETQKRTESQVQEIETTESLQEEELVKTSKGNYRGRQRSTHEPPARGSKNVQNQPSEGEVTERGLNTKQFATISKQKSPAKNLQTKYPSRQKETQQKSELEKKDDLVETLKEAGVGENKSSRSATEHDTNVEMIVAIEDTDNDGVVAVGDSGNSTVQETLSSTDSVAKTATDKSGSKKEQSKERMVESTVQKGTMDTTADVTKRRVRHKTLQKSTHVQKLLNLPKDAQNQNADSEVNKTTLTQLDIISTEADMPMKNMQDTNKVDIQQDALMNQQVEQNGDNNLIQEVENGANEIPCDEVTLLSKSSNIQAEEEGCTTSIAGPSVEEDRQAKEKMAAVSSSGLENTDEIPEMMIIIKNLRTRTVTALSPPPKKSPRLESSAQIMTPMSETTCEKDFSESKRKQSETETTRQKRKETLLMEVTSKKSEKGKSKRYSKEHQETSHQEVEVESTESQSVADIAEKIAKN